VDIIKLKIEHKKFIDIIIDRIMKHWDMNYNDAHDEVYRWINNVDNSICYIGVLKDEIIATAVVDTKNDDVEYKADVWFTFLWVDEKHRGNNYGWMLSQKRFEYVKTLGYKKVHLDTVQAREYHLRFGWIDVEQTTYKNKIDYIMCFNLANNQFADI
jgi:GNAT superfamily N-acetyltransferase